MVYAAGAAVSPVIGGYLTDIYGFKGCADLIGACTLLYAAMHFLTWFFLDLFG